jgi:hypothetical protein
MSRLREALDTIAAIENLPERSLELAGLVSTLFRVRSVELIVTGQLAFDSYAARTSPDAELELAAFEGKLTPRLLQEIMGGELQAEGSLTRWTLLGIPIRFRFESSLALRNLCRDLRTQHGVVRLWPAEEITAERVLAAVFPAANPAAERDALAILTNALIDAFDMDWIALRKLCHEPQYRVGEELIELRVQAKRNADALGLTKDPFGYEQRPAAEPEESCAAN